MAPAQPELLLAHQAARAGRTAPRPREALPRRLQACMQELLTVNERYHEVLHQRDSLLAEVNTLRAETQRLRAALARSEAKSVHHEAQYSTMLSTSEALREASALQTARTSAMEAEKGQLEQLLEACMGQLSSQQKEIEGLQEYTREVEELKAQAFQAGFDDGMAQQQAEHSSELRRLQLSAKSQAEQAFDEGKRRASADLAATLMREQAQRRLLLHRADEQREQRTSLEGQLLREQRARTEAQEKRQEYESRLHSVRRAKGMVEGELLATRTAHAQDLQHFKEMEQALGVAVNEFASLATVRARAKIVPEMAFSPPRAFEAAEGRGNTLPGSSPPDALRTRAPRPSEV
ncbi:hypothetical protein AB1Y20_016858 [Prymnesium parvum]|uniref:Uncharacterized protein n=1 Tax=Prymnesium parvum TaxID=97485 RepID=A0AB34IC72_PRYPA